MHISDDPNQQERIKKLRAELDKLGGYQIPLTDVRRYARRVSAAHPEYETAESITLFKLLKNESVDVPAPIQLDV